MSISLNELEKHAREGEEPAMEGSIKTEALQYAITVSMTMAETIFEVMNNHKQFRMELVFDAESCSAKYCFFTPVNDKCESDDSNQEFQQDGSDQ